MRRRCSYPENHHDDDTEFKGFHHHWLEDQEPEFQGFHHHWLEDQEPEFDGFHHFSD